MDEAYSKQEYWMESADYDLQTARAMLETKRFLYVGFMCHQTIEKALKGIFVARHPEEELPYIHRLVRLSNLCGITEELSEEQLLLLDTLNPLNIEARYPTHKSLLFRSLTEERCKELITGTEALLTWLRTKL
ncbi:MAG: HEPN domain-containing protein [Clostridia bacterium]|nr:HEPN domain-containing protein [Clostridia bacterium]